MMIDTRILMCREYPVLSFEMDSQTRRVVHIGDLFDRSRLPFSFWKSGPLLLSRAGMQEWWDSRTIPLTRDGLDAGLQSLDLSSPSDLLNRSLGLSLSDQYWVCPQNSDLRWKDVNFFHHDFDESVGKALFGLGIGSVTSFSTPDATSGGDLTKRWSIAANGTRVLIKAARTGQEPSNELIATKLAQRLGINHVEYSLSTQEGRPVSICAEMLTDKEELIPAWPLVNAFKRDNRDSSYSHWIRCAERTGLEHYQATTMTDDFLLTDYLMRNTDRHFNNFGIIRDVQTLETRPAPLFDTGDSLWNGAFTISNADYRTKPFTRADQNGGEKQLQMIRDWSRYDLSALTAWPQEVADILSQNPLIPPQRIALIEKMLEQRVGNVAHRRKRDLSPMTS